MNPFRQAAKLALSAVMPRRRWLTRGSGRMPCGRPTISLTFDDGPEPRTTEELLDALKVADVRATFFLIGSKMEAASDLVRRMVDEGHELANHSYWHYEPGETSAVDLANELNETDAAIRKYSAQAPRLMRPPKGELSLAKLRLLWRERWSVMLWNVDPRDYRMKSTAEMEAFCAKYQPRHGDILLMHDNHRFAAAAVRYWAKAGFFSHVHTALASKWTLSDEERAAADHLRASEREPSYPGRPASSARLRGASR